MKQYTLCALLLIIVSIVTNACWACSDEDFDKFKADFKKVYESSDEEAKRHEIFCKNMELVKTHNERYELGEESYKLGINNFSDWDHDEVQKRLFGLRRHHRRRLH